MKVNASKVQKSIPSKRNGKNLEARADKLSRLKKRNFIIGDSEDLVHMNWLAEWTEPEKFDK